MSRDILGHYPVEIVERDNEIIIRFYPKTKDAEYPEQEVFNLRFDITDKYRRNQIKQIVEELINIDS